MRCLQAIMLSASEAQVIGNGTLQAAGPRLQVWWSVYSRHLVEMCPVCFILWAIDVSLNRS